MTDQKTLLEQSGYPAATPEENAAVDYWIEHTDEIYNNSLHVSAIVIDAFKAGAKYGKEQK